MNFILPFEDGKNQWNRKEKEGCIFIPKKIHFPWYARKQGWKEKMIGPT